MFDTVEETVEEEDDELVTVDKVVDEELDVVGVEAELVVVVIVGVVVEVDETVELVDELVFRERARYPADARITIITITITRIPTLLMADLNFPICAIVIRLTLFNL